MGGIESPNLDQWKGLVVFNVAGRLEAAIKPIASKGGAVLGPEYPIRLDLNNSQYGGNGATL